MQKITTSVKPQHGAYIGVIRIGGLLHSYTALSTRDGAKALANERAATLRAARP